MLVLPQVLVGERSPETEVRSFLQAILDADTDTVREHMVEPEDGVLDLIRLLRPDVLVQDPVGAPDTVAGGEMLQEWGGTVRKPEPAPVG